MPFQIRWSWISIFHSLLVQPSFARFSHDILAMKVMDNLFSVCQWFVKGKETLLLQLRVGLFLFIRKRRQVVVEPEAGADSKPSWRMVDGKAEKKVWWGLGHNAQASPPIEPLGHDGRSRTQRLKAALGLRVPEQPIFLTHRSTIMSPPRPMPTDKNLQPRYPDSLERGGIRDPPPSLPQIPTITIQSTHQHLKRKLI